MSAFLKATAVAVATMAVVAALAATAEAAGSYYIPTPATPDFLLSPIFLWVAANVIIVFLFSSSRRRGRTANDDTAAPTSDADGGSGEVVVPGAVDSSFYASEYEASFSDAAPPSGHRRAADDAPVPSKRLTREARAAARRSDRPRVRKKPELAAGQDAPWATVVVEGERDETATPAGSVAAASDAESTRPGVDDDEDVSMDSLWASIVQRRAARPVVVQKSESWGNEELPRLQRVAETTAAARRQVRKSVSAVAKASASASASAAPTTTTTQPPQPSSAVRQTGWRTRDVLFAISPDDLLRRAESFIRRQREDLRLQRQESEQRQLLLQRGLYGGGHAPAPAAAPLIRAGV